MRIKQHKKVFNKGDYIKFSDKAYEVESVQKHKIKLKGLERLFKPDDLKKVKQIIEVEEDDGKDKIIEKQQNERKVKRRVRKEGIELNKSNESRKLRSHT